MLTYIPDFLSRFAPMASGAMTVVPFHEVPSLEQMDKALPLPAEATILDGQHPQAGIDLWRVFHQFHSRIVPIIKDKPINYVGNDMVQGWTGDHPLEGAITITDYKAGSTTVKLTALERGGLLKVDVTKKNQMGSFCQRNTVDLQGNVSTIKYELETKYNFGKGMALPVLSGWDFVTEGLKNFDPDIFLYDLRKLGAALRKNNQPLEFAITLLDYESDEDQLIGSLDVPEDDLCRWTTKEAELGASLRKCLPQIIEGGFCLFATLLRKGRLRRESDDGKPFGTMSVSVDDKNVSLDFRNVLGLGLLPLPDILSPALSIFAP